MLLLPDIGTTQLDPFRAAKTLNVNCFVHDPFTREPTAATRATWRAKRRSMSRARASLTLPTLAPRPSSTSSIACGSTRPSTAIVRRDDDAGVDGIRNKIESPTPVDKDLYELPPEEAADITQAPTGLASVIDQLEQDHEYLTEGGVFTDELIETWITLKRGSEIAPLSIRPQPMEFELYFGC
jgi:glutamine synthetase